MVERFQKKKRGKNVTPKGIEFLKIKLPEPLIKDFNKIEDVMDRIDLALYELLKFEVYMENLKIENNIIKKLKVNKKF